MKQTALMVVLLLLGTVGPIAMGPFIGVAIYYLFAVLRPQYIWEWSLPPNVGWSFYVAVATIVATAFYLPRIPRSKVLTPAHVAFLAFAGWVTLSNIFAINKEVSSPIYWEYAKIFIMFFCSTLVIQKLDYVRTLYIIGFGAVAYIAYEMNSLYIFDKRLDIYFNGFGGLDNNGAGLMVAMAIPMAYFLWQAYNRWWRWLILALIPMMLHAVLLSYSRGAMLALLLAVPVLVLRSLHNKGKLILFGAIIAVLLPILAGQEVRDRFFSIEQYEEDNSAQSRFDSWMAGYKIAKDHPMLGVGLRNADLMSYEYGADVTGRAIHSQYFQIMADSGFPAIILYLLFLFFTWRSLGRARRLTRALATPDDYLAYNLASGIEGAMIVFCVGATFLSVEVFEFPYLIFLLGAQLQVAVKRVPATSPNLVPGVRETGEAYAKV